MNLQQIKTQAEILSRDPQTAIGAFSDLDSFEWGDPNVSQQDVITGLLAYVLLRIRNGFSWNSDMRAIHALQKYGLTVTHDAENNKLLLALES